MKPDSEIGVAIRAGHPCYFIGFSPEPMPGQTIEDVCRAEALFIEEVARRHPKAERNPIVIANCQAGWQTMMTAAIRPDLMGPILVVGSPISYWAGVRGKNPMRYLGGVLGGTWLTALSETSAPASSMARTSSRISSLPTSPTPSGPRNTTSTRTSTRRRSASCRSRPGGAVPFSPTPAKCNGSSTTCSSATAFDRPNSLLRRTPDRP